MLNERDWCLAQLGNSNSGTYEAYCVAENKKRNDLRRVKGLLTEAVGILLQNITDEDGELDDIQVDLSNALEQLTELEGD